MGWPSGLTLEAEPTPSLLCPHGTPQPSLDVLPPACLLDQRGPGWQTRSVPRCQEHSPSLTSALGRGRGSPLGVGPAWTRPAPGHWALGSRPVCLLLPLTRLCLMIDNLPLE